MQPLNYNGHLMPLAGQTPVSQNSAIKKQIDEQKNLLIHNTTHFLTIQYLFETSYGFTPKYLWKTENQYLLKKDSGQTNTSNYTLYTQMLKEATDLATGELTLTEKKQKIKPCAEAIEEKLRIVFFNTINQLNEKSIQKFKSDRSTSCSFVTGIRVGLIRANHARLQWKAKVIYYVFNKIIQVYVKKLISAHIKLLNDYIKRTGTDNLKNELINNLTSLLTTLNVAYNNTTRNDGMGTPNERLNAELSREIANDGKTPETLYKEVADTLIISTLGHRRGRVASKILQWFIKPGEIVESLTQTIAESSKDNKGFSHPIKTLVLEKLKEIEKDLAKPSTPSTTTPISGGRKRQLEGIITQIVEIINKSDKTMDELTHVVKGTGFPLEVHRRHVETIGMQALMNNLVPVISDFIESTVTEKSLDSSILNLLKTTNDCFIPTKRFTDAEMAETERQVDETTERILTQLIDLGCSRALDNKASLSPEALEFLDPQPKAQPAPAEDLSIPTQTPNAPPPQTHYSYNPLSLIAGGCKKASDYVYSKRVDLAAVTLAAAAGTTAHYGYAYTWIPVAILTTPFLFKKGTAFLTETIKTQSSALDTKKDEAIKKLEILTMDTLKKVEDYAKTTLPTLIEDYAKPAVRKVAKEKVKGLLKLAEEPSVYLSGLHHLLFIPHLKAMQKTK